MSDKPKNMEASVRARLLNIARAEKLNYDFILLMYMQERLLYRLSISDYNDFFILKGGLLILSVLNIKTRPTRDIDFLAISIPNNLDRVRLIFKEIAEIKINDGVKYDPESVKVEKITEGADYDGIRVKIKTYIGSAEKNIQIDLGFGDVVVPDEVKMDYPGLLDFNKPNIKAYSLETVIAEKFEAILSLSLINSRMKDFYDIYILSKEKDFIGRVLSKAIKATIENRKTEVKENHPVFEEKFANDKVRNQMWQSYLKKIGKEPFDFNESMKRLNEFLLPIYNNILDNTEFSGKWNKENNIWNKHAV